MAARTNNVFGTCQECAGLLRDGMTCWEQLGLLLAWEYDDPDLQAEHFLTVACYNLQHPAQFTDDTFAALKAVFIEHLDNGLPVEQIRRRIGQVTAGSKRVIKDDAERHPVLRAWPITIGDVYIPDQPAGAAKRVREWAISIRSEL